MDPFTQNILERAEKRAAALGIASTSKFPLSEFNCEQHSGEPPIATASPTKRISKKNPAPRSPSGRAPAKVVGATRIDRKSGSNSGKDGVDLALEINITTGPNVQVAVEVEERELDADGKVKERVEGNKQSIVVQEKENMETKNLIRDHSRDQLQRLGTLYSDAKDLSSPVHRTEGKFHEDVKENSRPRNKLAKLAMLADSINNWEDDTSHPDITHHRETILPGKTRSPERNSPKKQPATAGAITKKYTAPNPPKSILSPQKDAQVPGKAAATKSLKWDQKVMDALESQGFQRRESTTSKLVYDYNEQEQKLAAVVEEKTVRQRTSVVEQESREYVRQGSQEKPKQDAPKKPEVAKGLVSGRAAMYEKSNKRQSILKNQKDPAEMSLKERLAIFEKNKGTALVPKAAFGINPSLKQISNEKSSAGGSQYKPPSSCAAIQGSGFGSIVRDAPSKATVVASKPKTDTYNKPQMAESTASGNAIRNTVAALMANNSTLSESQIAEDIRRQRQQEMEMLLNRFTKPVDMSSDCGLDDGDNYERPIPSAPPMPPQGYLTSSGKKKSKNPSPISGHKRRSDESKGDSVGVLATLDDVKRIKVAPAKHGRMYPALSDIETTATESGEDGGDDYTTATVSGSENEQYKTCYGHEAAEAEDDDDAEYDEEHSYGHEEEEDDEADGRQRVENEDADSFMYSDDEDDSSGGICDISLGQEILQAVKTNGRRSSQHRRRQSQDRKIVHNGRNSGANVATDNGNSSASEVSGLFDDMDAIIDEALDDASDEEFDTPRKSSVSSNSFSYQKNPRPGQCETIGEEDEKKDTPKSSPSKQRVAQYEPDYDTPVRSEMKVTPSEDNNMVTLVHTVSFYRRQQSAQNVPTPSRKPFRTPPSDRAGGDSVGEEDSDEGVSSAESTVSTQEKEYMVQEKIKQHLDEVCKQQTIIAQASQALNLCASTIEFSGSTEAVEGERHLLVATHRRQAILEEVQRLRVEGCLRPQGAPKEKGRLIVKGITLPLKQDYLRKLASDTISGHQLVCLLKYNETVLATQVVPTLPGLLSVQFPDKLQLSNVFADFKITMEVYGMTAQREVLPHEIKYHIAVNKKGSSKLHTPKGVKSNSRLIMPPVQSPAGPHAVRTPSMVPYGFIIFSLKESKRTAWTLNQAASVSPLEGTVHMNVNCELMVTCDYRGFLTMYEDVSGFGAWHRRWCHLQGHVINYWKYPDDEKRKAPIGSIDLQGCSTRQVAVAPRDICARLNTLLLEFRRAARDDDVESLTLVRQGKATLVRYLLSADSKEEREEWCAHLNKTLLLMKTWGGPPSGGSGTSC